MKRFFGMMTVAMLATMMGSVLAGENDEAAKHEALITGSHRADGNAERNKYRNPGETLSFFGVKEDMHVVEISPGGGWYTEILAPLLREKGKYVAAGYDPASDKKWAAGAVKRFEDKMAAHPESYDKVEMGVFMGTKMEIGEPASADMVLTFRNVHNWMGAGTVTASFAKFYEVLKPGGVFGLVEHRGDAKTEQDPKASNGYVNEEYLIKLAEAAGFILVGSSEVNANAKDTKNYASGVWSLPPTLHKAGENKGKLTAIGESDRATLKFVKP